MFRPEVSLHRSDRLSGDVAIAIPVAWQAIGLLIIGGLAAAITFLSLARYARVETVSGIIVPDKGVAAILPSRPGVVIELHVREGDTVSQGAMLAHIRAEEDANGAESAAAKIEAAIARQDASLAAEVQATGASALAQQGQLAAQQAGLAAEIAQIESQITLQHDLVASAQRDLDRARTVAVRGFISGRDLQIREETLLQRQQQLSQLTQSLSSRRASLREAERNSVQVSAQARAQAATIAGTRAQVAQQAASAKGGRSYVLRAPVGGRVATLVARIGQPASPQTSLMTIIPAGSRLRAELAVPSSGIGFVKPEQEVRVALDAFPYQRFGTITGRIATVASTAMAQPGANGAPVPVYQVTVALSEPQIMAFGRAEALVSGMTLTARITTERQSLLEWLFEPLFAVRRR